jgi:hypothetical protein
VSGEYSGSVEVGDLICFSHTGPYSYKHERCGRVVQVNANGSWRVILCKKDGTTDQRYKGFRGNLAVRPDKLVRIMQKGAGIPNWKLADAQPVPGYTIENVCTHSYPSQERGYAHISGVLVKTPQGRCRMYIGEGTPAWIVDTALSKNETYSPFHTAREFFPTLQEEEYEPW